MPNGTISQYPTPTHAAIEGFRHPDGTMPILHFVYLQGECRFFGTPDACIRYFYRQRPSSCIISTTFPLP